MKVAMKAIAALLAVFAPLSQAVQLNVTNSDSIKNATSTIAYGLVKYYTGNVTNTQQTVGVLPGPYYWWEAGAMWGALLDYYHFTGDDTYNNITTQALLSQVGPLYDYMVPWHQKDEGNDDQAFWGFAIMSAAEKDYPQPTVGNYSWVELTENLWNTIVRRWDTTSCNGGLKWQIFPFNNGYDYKNSVSNGAFFQLSARLARFTGNQTYVEWAEKSLQWSMDVGLITDDYLYIWDGTDDTSNCTSQDHVIWTYNTGIYMYGAAVMYNYTNGSAAWDTRLRGFFNATGSFFSPYNNATGIMFEPACETVHTCDNDQYSFKGYLSRFMWASTLMAPFLTPAITTLLQTSSIAAAQACSGGDDGSTCGEHWYYGGFDGIYGVGQQMSAMETLQGLLIQDSIPPLHADQVHLMNAPTTSTAPLPSSTSSTSSTLSPSGITTYDSSTSSQVMSSAVIGQDTQISSVPFSSSSIPLTSSVALASSASTSSGSSLAISTSSSKGCSPPSGPLSSSGSSLSLPKSTTSASSVPMASSASTSNLSSHSTILALSSSGLLPSGVIDSGTASSANGSLAPSFASSPRCRPSSGSAPSLGNTSTSNGTLSKTSSPANYAVAAMTNQQSLLVTATASPSATKQSNARKITASMRWFSMSVGIWMIFDIA